jgi:hypothetical protein
MRLVRPSTSSEKATHTTVDTVELSSKLVASWKSPPFQRDLKITQKVMECAEEIGRTGGVLPGILTIGVLDGETYVVDGQHRIAAWQQTGLSQGYVDVRTHWFNTMGDMAAEYVRLNSALVRLRPDDILRGMEPSNQSLQRLRRKCGFIGYDMVRRSEKAPVLSMTMYIRTWIGTKAETPQALPSLLSLAAMDDQETTDAIDFASLCYEAWRRDVEYARLWSALNLTLCAWLYRRVVLGERLHKQSKGARLTKDEFRKGLMAVSADQSYLDYLVGRKPSERDRSPAYVRLKSIFVKRYFAETGKTIRLPQPPWAHG